MHILGRSLRGGLHDGVASALGITAGSVRILTAAAGLSLLLATSPLAFTSVKLAGGAYPILTQCTTVIHEQFQATTTASAGEVCAGRRGALLQRGHGRCSRRAVRAVGL